MVSKFSALALVVLYFSTPGVNGDECIPGAVWTLRIAANSTLSWEVDSNEPCEVTEFQVDVVGDRDDEFHFKVTDTHVDLSFLNICEEWTFVVTPISNGVVGFERRLVEYVPLPPSADISLRYLNATQIDSRDILLEWDLMDHSYGDCTLRYRLTIKDESEDTIHDIYVTGSSAIINNVSPCVSYQLSLRAVNRAHPTIEGPVRFTHLDLPPHREDPPRLISIETGATSINTTWRLENPGNNRCPIRTLYVDGGTHFNISIPLEDSEERPPVEVNLKGLRPNSMYYFRVSVENSAGLSPASPVAIQTTELEPGSV